MPDQPKTKIQSFRVSQRERQFILHEAASRGLKISDYMRVMALNQELPPEPTESVVHPDVHRDLMDLHHAIHSAMNYVEEQRELIDNQFTKVQSLKRTKHEQVISKLESISISLHGLAIGLARSST